MSAPSLSQRIAQFAFATDARALPAAVAGCAAEHVLDAVGVGVAGASIDGAGRLHAAVRALGAASEASVLGFAGKLPASSAALLNGTLIHSLEYDDTHIGSIVHGSSVIVAAALAAGERAGASVAEVLRAVAIGWEVLIRLGLAAPGAFQRRGFQVTSAGGPFAASLVATLLARGTPGDAVSAMGIAGSQSSGVFEFLSEGASVKAMHPGWAAHAGLVASQLAGGGMTGPTTILEGRHGFYRTYADDADAADRLSALLGSLGSQWMLLEAAIKGHPCCHYLHPFLECGERLHARNVRPADIASVVCEVPPGEAMLICEPWERKRAPASGYDAKFSLPYALGVVLCDGRVELDTFASAADHRGALELAERIEWRPMAQSRFPERFEAAVSVRLRDGTTIVERVDQVRGSSERPFTRAEIVVKFEANARRRLAEAAVEALRDALLAGGPRPMAEVTAPLQSLR